MLKFWLRVVHTFQPRNTKASTQATLGKPASPLFHVTLCSKADNITSISNTPKLVARQSTYNANDT